MIKFAVTALITAILIGGMVLVSCDDSRCSYDRTCVYSYTDGVGNWCEKPTLVCFGKDAPSYGARCICDDGKISNLW